MMVGTEALKKKKKKEEEEEEENEKMTNSKTHTCPSHLFMTNYIITITLTGTMAVDCEMLEMFVLIWKIGYKIFCVTLVTEHWHALDFLKIC